MCNSTTGTLCMQHNVQMDIMLLVFVWGVLFFTPHRQTLWNDNIVGNPVLTTNFFCFKILFSTCMIMRLDFIKYVSFGKTVLIVPVEVSNCMVLSEMFHLIYIVLLARILTKSSKPFWISIQNWKYSAFLLETSRQKNPSKSYSQGKAWNLVPTFFYWLHSFHRFHS